MKTKPQLTRTALATLALALAPGVLAAQNASTPASTSASAPLAVTASPNWSRALPGAPDTSTKMTESYARLIARDTYVWAWPMANIYNRRLVFSKAPARGLMNGVLPLAPLGTMSMLSDYVAPQQRWVACPNQDVVYGAAIAALDISPVIVQVPDFGKRFWVYQIVDLRTDSFAALGSMYGTQPGFYLLVGPDWKGEVPKGIAQVFRSPTSTAFVVPRVFQDDSAEDRKAIQPLISGIDVYPLAEFDGTMKTHDWAKLPKFMPPAGSADSGGETKWVFPETFFDQLADVLKDAPPLPGEEARYAQIFALLDAVQKNPALKKAVIDEAQKAEKEVVDPLLQFRDWGVQLPNNWSTVGNGAKFGADYYNRLAVARSNILVNAPNETKYYYLDLDSKGGRLNSAARHTITFVKGQTPPVNGFWSLTLYDAQHFFVPNEINRYSLGTKNKTLKYNADGSLTLYIQADAPAEDQRTNWLPAPKGNADFTLYLRAYWPKTAVIDGSWAPPGVEKK